MTKKAPIKLPEHLRKRRLDLSAWLWHFVRRDENPKGTLQSIIQDKAIKGSICRPFSEHVVCFTETPLFAHIQQDVDLKNWEYARFSLYGIGFSRNWLYEQGARPVIYTQRRYYDVLPDQLKHLFVEFDLSKRVDFSWQREWRIKTKEFKVDRSMSILVFPDHNEFQDLIYDYYADFDVGDGEVITYAGVDKIWNFIPLDFCETFDYESIIAYIDENFYDDIEPITLDVL
jgi:hypothetical protein